MLLDGPDSIDPELFEDDNQSVHSKLSKIDNTTEVVCDGMASVHQGVASIHESMECIRNGLTQFHEEMTHFRAEMAYFREEMKTYHEVKNDISTIKNNIVEIKKEVQYFYSYWTDSMDQVLSECFNESPESFEEFKKSGNEGILHLLTTLNNLPPTEDNITKMITLGQLLVLENKKRRFSQL